MLPQETWFFTLHRASLCWKFILHSFPKCVWSIKTHVEFRISSASRQALWTPFFLVMVYVFNLAFSHLENGFFDCKRPTILWSWLVCNLPRSPKFVFHTMSSFPITVTPLITPAFSANSCLGFRQYKYWRVSIGCKYVLEPNVETLEERTLFLSLNCSFQQDSWS